MSALSHRRRGWAGECERCGRRDYRWRRSLPRYRNFKVAASEQNLHTSMSWYEAPSPSRVRSQQSLGHPTGDMNDSEDVQYASQSNVQRQVSTSPPFPLEQEWPYYPFHGFSHLVAYGPSCRPQSADYYRQTATPGMPTQYNPHKRRIFNPGQARQMNTNTHSTAQDYSGISFLTQNQTTNTTRRGLFGIPESDNVRAYTKDQSRPPFSGTQMLPLIATKCARRIIAPTFLDTLQDFIPSLFTSMASPSNNVPMGSSLEVVKRRGYFEQHLPADALLIELACFIVNQAWFTSHNREPPLQETEEAVQVGRLPSGPSHSRFDLFFDARDKHRCVWIDNNQRCCHQAQRLGRARGHAHRHFKYKPFACEGGCGVPQCQERYTSVDFLKDHLRRKLSPKKQCGECLCMITAQNLKRHMRLHE